MISLYLGPNVIRPTQNCPFRRQILIHIFVPATSQDLDFQHHMSWFFVWSMSYGERWSLVYVGRIVAHHCLAFIFIRSWGSETITSTKSRSWLVAGTKMWRGIFLHYACPMWNWQNLIAPSGKISQKTLHTFYLQEFILYMEGRIKHNTYL
jgi:hypothetical protein